LHDEVTQAPRLYRLATSALHFGKGEEQMARRRNGSSEIWMIVWFALVALVLMIGALLLLGR